MKIRFLTRCALLSVAAAATVHPVRGATVTPGFQDELVVGSESVVAPTSITFHPITGEMWITEKGSGISAGTARVRVVGADGVIRTALALPCVDSGGERGLMDILFDPDTAGGVRAYIFYTRRRDASVGCGSAAEPDSVNVVVRFNESQRLLNGEVTLMEGPSLLAISELHNGGTVRLLPDRTLLVSMGDNAILSEFELISQDLSDLRGKILRIGRDGSIPADNPFVGVPGARPEIWAIGFRNPFRFTVHPETGSVLLTDVGETKWEEADLGVPGANYGWPCFEANEVFVACPPVPPGTYTFPVLFYHHGTLTPPVQGSSIVGGPVYTGTAFPAEYRGNWFFADYSRRWIRRAALGEDGLPQASELFASQITGPVDLEVGPDGCMYYAAIGSSEIRRICYAGGSNGQPTAVAAAAPRSGQPPLEVFFSGSGSSDPDGDPLAFAWSFGDGGASGSKATSHIYTMPGIYESALVVSDLADQPNSTDRSAPILIVAGNDAPQVALEAPADGQRYNAGQSIAFSGTAIDPQDGALAAAALSWTVVFHHGDHVHPFLGPLAGLASGSFTIPDKGESATDVWYELLMTATDSGAPIGAAGRLTSTARVVLQPNVSSLALEADPPVAGLTLDLDGVRTEAPFTRSSVVGWPRALGAQTAQTIGGRPFTFESWSDGGASTHTVVTPSSDTIYRARFSCPTLSSPSDISVSGPVDGWITLTWPPSTDPCLEDRPGFPRYRVYRSTTPRPASMPGDFPMDPLFSLVGQTIATSLTLMPLNPKEFYVVVEIGRDGQAGPAGHY